jgi:hypothetical protein
VIVVGNSFELLVLNEFRRLNLLTVVMPHCAGMLYKKRICLMLNLRHVKWSVEAPRVSL